MAVPKKKTSKSRRNMRRSHDFISPANYSKCPNCGAFVLSHCVCTKCNYYNGRNIKTGQKVG